MRREARSHPHPFALTAAVEAGVDNLDKWDPLRVAHRRISFERQHEVCPEASQMVQHAGGKSARMAREETLASDDDVRTPACGSPLLRMDGVRLFVFDNDSISLREVQCGGTAMLNLQDMQVHVTSIDVVL